MSLKHLFNNIRCCSGLWECDICPDGFYCLPENVTAGDPTSGYHDCPPGYYCPTGTGLDWQPCPRGTYSMSENLFRVRTFLLFYLDICFMYLHFMYLLFQANQCSDCDGGFYCDVEAATNVSGLCAAGHYCESGVDIPNPHHENVRNETIPSA